MTVISFLNIIGNLCLLACVLLFLMGFDTPNTEALFPLKITYFVASFSCLVSCIFTFALGKILFVLGEIRNALVAGFELEIDTKKK